MPGICVRGKCSFQCLLYYWRVYAKAFYARYIIKLFRISTKIDYLCIDRPSSVSLALHRRLFPRCSGCALFSECMTQHFSLRAGAHLRLFARNSASIPATYWWWKRCVNHFWALRFDAAATKALAWCSSYQVSSLGQISGLNRCRDNLVHYCIIVTLSRWVFYQKA